MIEQRSAVNGWKTSTMETQRNAETEKLPAAALLGTWPFAGLKTSAKRQPTLVRTHETRSRIGAITGTARIRMPSCNQRDGM